MLLATSGSEVEGPAPLSHLLSPNPEGVAQAAVTAGVGQCLVASLWRNQGPPSVAGAGHQKMCPQTKSPACWGPLVVAEVAFGGGAAEAGRAPPSCHAVVRLWLSWHGPWSLGVALPYDRYPSPGLLQQWPVVLALTPIGGVANCDVVVVSQPLAPR